VYRRWKKERQDKEEYLRLRREFREKCKEKGENWKADRGRDQEYHNRGADMEICELG